MLRPVSRLSAFALLSFSVSHAALAVNYNIPNDLSGATAVMQSAGYGAGVVFGDIDTGITPQWIGFTPAYNGQGVSNIDTVNSGICLSGVCKAGGTLTDPNGHGTFTASQIVGGIQTANANFSGVARAGKLISVQVLNAQGSGTNTDIANGIRYAVDRGAQVLNLSLGPTGTGSQQAAFYSAMASAINYAASKNVYVVFAGGNSSQNLAGGLKVTGFTDAAIQRLIFVGSTNSGDGVHASSVKLSSFSNKPGNGTFQSTSGKITADKNMWVMADGGDVKSSWFSTTISDPVWGASTSNSGACAGYGCLVQKVGTSMAAPQVTGAIGLLIHQWPVLVTNGTAAQILEQTATDLGAAGVDAVYGNGFINLVKAFQPVGGTYAVTSSGATVPVGQGGASSAAVSGSAMGSMPRLSTALSNYTVFDGFQRDFAANLSGLVSTRPMQSALAQSLTAPKVTQTNVHFTDGSRASFGSMENTTPVLRSSGQEEAGMVASFTDASGITFAAGRGFPASASFANALWGDDSPASGQVYALGASNALQNLAQGGYFTAVGRQLGADTRVAVAWSQTRHDMQSGPDWSWANPDASAFGAGFTHKLNSRWTAGMTMNLLNERSGMLGTVYAPSGPLTMGERNRSVSFGASSALDLGGSLDFLLDAAIVRTNGAQFEGGLISDVTPVYARSLGASLVQRDAAKEGDSLAFSVRAPLRVTSGSAALATSSVDSLGLATTATQRIGLRPDGNELNFSLAYQAPVNERVSWNVTAISRRDADNIRGLNDNGVLVGTDIRF